MKSTHETLVKRVEQLEKFRVEIQAICESGKHRTKHTQLQMCSFLDRLRSKSLEADISKCPDNSEVLQIEAKARSIYESWADRPGFVPWEAGGNSTMQEVARAEARRLFSMGPSNNLPTC
ncbi:hypothetical protein [Pseudomonas sp. Irchel 3E19]|uniref:hypothetical protein n=1 Tax=Pseudomonas sp. Irchel 3E19 TaxID=2008981 RepID=UPI000BA2D184|nr:hypothetical protein [Pseudomonas sp. Irchel 3E19]